MLYAQQQKLVVVVVKKMPTWRNWQTRTVQVRVPQGLWVQLPPSVPFITTRKWVVMKKNCGYGITAVHQPSKLVIGVRPPLPAPYFSGGIPEWPKGADCKSASTSFDGSNPSSTTIFCNKAPQARCFFFAKGGMEDRTAGAAADHYRGRRSAVYGTEAKHRRTTHIFKLLSFSAQKK